MTWWKICLIVLAMIIGVGGLVIGALAIFIKRIGKKLGIRAPQVVYKDVTVLVEYREDKTLNNYYSSRQILDLTFYEDKNLIGIINYITPRVLDELDAEQEEENYWGETLTSSREILDTPIYYEHANIVKMMVDENAYLYVVDGFPQILE